MEEKHGKNSCRHCYVWVESRRMLKKSANSVLVSLRPSKYQMKLSEVEIAVGAFPFAKIHSRGGTAHTKCGMYLLVPSLAAVLPAEWRV